MKLSLVILCLIGAVFANPIPYNAVLETSELEANTTESLSLSQSSENDMSQHQNSAENTSEQSSESESLETTSEDTTSEESNSQSDESNQITQDLISETRDDSMGSEENVRKNLVPMLAKVANALSAEDDNSTEVKGQPDLSNEQTDKLPAFTAFKQGAAAAQPADTPAGSSDTTSESAESSDVTTAAPDSSSSSESNESSDESRSPEDSGASDSAELPQIRAQPCGNATQSCESEEVFQAIGDDGHHPVDTLMAPDEEEMELSLRRR
ncbi:secretory calcium-binding phosphoprotein 1 [Betta splendens]|uniref:Secretory calcium-binding phosphoprotein 1 n=1 Tax=Betta splendens TaxID=158456 RepID=A0A6P7N6E4_BETSP|nr:secretory calcium-binding phosphoprotein 1 [Betta splendens]